MRMLALWKVLPRRNFLKLELSESFDRFFKPVFIYGKSHPDIAFPLLSKTISGSGHNSYTVKQEPGELGRGISFRNPDPKVEGCLGLIHFQPDLPQSFHHHIPSPLIHFNDFREGGLKLTQRGYPGFLDGLENTGVDVGLYPPQNRDDL
jgi:hypothetical protein